MLPEVNKELASNWVSFPFAASGIHLNVPWNAATSGTRRRRPMYQDKKDEQNDIVLMSEGKERCDAARTERSPLTTASTNIVAECSFT